MVRVLASETIAEAQRRFEAFKANSSTPELDSNIQSAVFASVVRWGGQTGYDDVLAVYRSTDIAAIKRRALRVSHPPRRRSAQRHRWPVLASTAGHAAQCSEPVHALTPCVPWLVPTQALAAATTPSLLQAALDLSISDEVRSQDTTGVVDSVAYNPLGRVLAWNFVTQNWQLFDERCVCACGAGLLCPTVPDSCAVLWGCPATPLTSRSSTKTISQSTSTFAIF